MLRDCDCKRREGRRGNGEMTIGDPDGTNMVISEDENGNVGITEFNY